MVAMSETIYICSVCGKNAHGIDPTWIIGQGYCCPEGELVIRCPEHIIGEDGLDARDLIE